MIQQLRTLVALAGDLDSILSTHMATDNHLQLQFWGIQLPLLASVRTEHMCSTGKSLIHINI